MICECPMPRSVMIAERHLEVNEMTTTKQRKIQALLDELIDNLDSVFYWVNQYHLNRPCDDEDNLDSLYVLQRYVENIERIIDSVRYLSSREAGE